MQDRDSNQPFFNQQQPPQQLHHAQQQPQPTPTTTTTSKPLHKIVLMMKGVSEYGSGRCIETIGLFRKSNTHILRNDHSISRPIIQKPHIKLFPPNFNIEFNIVSNVRLSEKIFLVWSLNEKMVQLKNSFRNNFNLGKLYLGVMWVPQLRA